MVEAGDGEPSRRYDAGVSELEPKDRAVLFEALVAGFPRNTDADLVLDRLGFPRSRRPDFEATDGPDAAWQAVFKDLDAGIVPDAYRALLSAADLALPWVRAIEQLSLRYGIRRPPTRPPTDWSMTPPKPGFDGRPLGPPPPPGPGQPTARGPSWFPEQPLVVVLGVDGTADDFATQNLIWVRRVEEDMGCVTARAAALPADLSGRFQPDILHVCAERVGRDLRFGRSGTLVSASWLAERFAADRLLGVLLNFADSAEVAEEFRGVARTIVAHDGDLEQHCALRFAWQTYFLLPRDRCMGVAARGAAKLLANHPDVLHKKLERNLHVIGDGAVRSSGRAERPRVAHPPRPDRNAPQVDIRLTPAECEDAKRAARVAFDDREFYERLLILIGYVGDRLRMRLNDDREQRWDRVFDDFQHGAFPTPYRSFLTHALGAFPYNYILRALADKHGVMPGPSWWDETG